MCLFFLAYRDRLLQKRQMPSGQLGGEKSQTEEDLKQCLLEWAVEGSNQ